MAGKYSISELKKGRALGARDLLLLFFAVFAQGCFIPSKGRMRPDGGVADAAPTGPWPPEILLATPAEPISNFEFAPETENCLFPISATLRDRDSDELDIRVVTDNHKQYRRRADGRKISVTDDEAFAEFLVPYLAFGPTRTSTTVPQHSISMFVADVLDAWAVSDTDAAIDESVTDLGRLSSDVEGNVVELRWTVVFKQDGCCPESLQEGKTFPCGQ